MESPGDTFFRARRGRKPYTCGWNFDDICHTFGEICTSGLVSQTISDCMSSSKLLHLKPALSILSGSQLKRNNFDGFLNKRMGGAFFYPQAHKVPVKIEAH